MSSIERIQAIWLQLMKNKQTLQKSLLKALALLGILTVSVNTLAWKLLYLPSIDGQYSENNQMFFRNPQERGMDYSNIEISKNGVILKGWFIKQPNFKTVPTVVFFHENAGNIGWRLEYLQKYYQIVKCNVVIVAYRGYNYSTGLPSQYGIQQDAEAITEHTFEELGIDTQQVFAHGRSLGGAVAAYAFWNLQQKSKYSYKGLILENTFTSVKDVVSNMNFLFKIISPFLLFNTWKTINFIGKIKSPIHFISSGRDELIPYPIMRQLVETAQTTRKTQFHIARGDHNSNWLVDPAEYFNSINHFIQSI